MKSSFEKVLDETVENYQRRVKQISEGAQSGKATSRSDMNSFIGENAQVTFVANLKMHLRKGLIVNGEEMEGFLKRAKVTVLRDKREGHQAIITLCDKLLPTVKPDMKWDKE